VGPRADRYPDPLPVADLHNLLQEFALNLSDAEGQPYFTNDHVLTRLIPLRADGLKYDGEAEHGASVRWVLGVSRTVLGMGDLADGVQYTLHSKTRNVVKDKG